jgi:hypothetical protein
VATRDLSPGTTAHTVAVTGSDLPGAAGDVGLIPDTTYWYKVLTVTQAGVQIDDNTGRCYSATIPPTGPALTLPWSTLVG